MDKVNGYSHLEWLFYIDEVKSVIGFYMVCSIAISNFTTRIFTD